jgi:hypothetical protein
MKAVPEGKIERLPKPASPTRRAKDSHGRQSRSFHSRADALETPGDPALRGEESGLSLVRFTGGSFWRFGFRVAPGRLSVRLHPGVKFGIRTLGTPQSDPRANTFEGQTRVSLFKLSRLRCAPGRLETWVQLPMARCSAIHWRLMVVSFRIRAAMRTWRASPLPACRVSAAFPPSRANFLLEQAQCPAGLPFPPLCPVMGGVQPTRRRPRQKTVRILSFRVFVSFAV